MLSAEVCHGKKDSHSGVIQARYMLSGIIFLKKLLSTLFLDISNARITSLCVSFFVNTNVFFLKNMVITYQRLVNI